MTLRFWTCKDTAGLRDIKDKKRREKVKKKKQKKAGKLKTGIWEETS